MKKFAVLNQKGGVGKTTVTANLGHAMARLGNRVLVIDLDPQGHLATSLGIFKAPSHGIYEVMMKLMTAVDVTINTRENMSIIPAGKQLGELERMGATPSETAGLLKDALNGELGDFDYVFIDCPPSSGMLVVNAILAVDEILVPVPGDYLSLNGLAKLLMTLKKFAPHRDVPLKQWFFMSRFVSRRRLSKEVREKLLQYFPGQVLVTAIREAAVMAECPSVGRTIFEYRAKSAVAQDFMSLADDVLEQRVS